MSVDLQIINGTIYDGENIAPKHANISIRDGVITEIGDSKVSAHRTIDADGHIVTPGFIDLHTHYDGQISWDEELRPSVNFGVTTALLGNCGVGFAPVRPHDHDRLVQLMEGVEDIPGTALHEGISWEWESFPEYMDAIDRIPHTIDFGVMAVHDPLRVYVMGERAGCEEDANASDREQMQHLLRQALDAGAAGFSTGRSDIHRSTDGEPTPASEANAAELAALGSTLKGRRQGVVQMVSDFNLEISESDFEPEFDLVEKFVRAAERPASISLMQRDFAPEQWKKILRETERLNADGVPLHVQVAPRAIGVFIGLQCTFHPLVAQPSYIKIMHEPMEKRLAILRDPAFKKQCLSEQPLTLSGAGSSIPPIVDRIISEIEQIAFKFFRLGEQPDYAQTVEQSLGAEAKRDGVSIMEKLYDVCLELDGKQLIYYPVYNYTEMNYDNVHTMLTHPNALLGLSDGGAHVGTICDASFPAYLLSYWARDREDSEIDITRAIRMLTSQPADYLDLKDRGRLAPGMRADINVIDYERLNLSLPAMVQDLPAGGQRLLQSASGFHTTMVNGKIVVEHDTITDERPGSLIRFNQ